MEMNANEKLYLSADGISEPCLNSSPAGQLRTIPHGGGGGGGKKIVHNNRKESVSPNPNKNPRRSLHNKGLGGQSHNLSGVAISDLAGFTMADTGVMKTVKARWRQDKRQQQESEEDEKRSSSSSSASDQLQNTSLEDQQRILGDGQIKPRNCRRIVVLGAPKVGKTNIVRRFLGDDFEELYVPTTEDFHRKLYHIRGKPYLIDILDAAREREFPAKRRLSILTGDIFLLAFSLTDRDSLKEVRNLRNEILSGKRTLMKLKDAPRVPMVICGNKADSGASSSLGGLLSRSEIGEVLGEDTAYFETSAKCGAGLEDVFRTLVTLGGLPGEIAPSQHQTIPLHTYQSLFFSSSSHHHHHHHQRGVVRRLSGERQGAHPQLDAPCAALCVLARRPSFTSDLKLVLRSSSSFSKNNKPKKCQIQ
ncbi:hypothetical protein NHX12_031824 [Muraenolepis orangiensis]|uniref:Small monomeric GTPase n=1 Tax=Muraenolepis orangiensis TaxID=630683 RepID=A0A9Q0IJB0_9TELE|nr:hypothetical protein NHX12_031824 [Muraenolepis orangiensis]